MTLLDQIKSCDTNRPYIFISYSSFDRELVWQDVLEFQRRGYNVWLDDKNLDKTKDSWKKDALAAIENYYCKLMIFYVSRWSMTSPACYDELCHTKDQRTRKLHKNTDLKYIAVETEQIGDIAVFYDNTFTSIMKREDIDIQVRQEQAIILADFIENFFDTNNEKVRIHPKDELNRKMDYYGDVTASFPDETKIYSEESLLPAEPVPVPEQTDTSSKTEPSPLKTLQTFNSALQDDEISDETVDFVLENAEQLEAETWYLMGCKYKEGLGVEKDSKKAANFFLMAAERGHADAQFWLAYGYMTGEGIEKDQEKALLWLRKSAEQDNTDAIIFLGTFLITGKGNVEHNPQEAEVLIRKIREKDPDRANELLEMLKKLQIPASELPASEPLIELPKTLLEEAVEKFWTPTFCLYFNDMSFLQRQSIKRNFGLTLNEQEMFYAFHYMFIKNRDRRAVHIGFFLTSKHLYIKFGEQKARIDLINLERIAPGKTEYVYNLHYKGGSFYENLYVSIYHHEIIDLLNYIIENRPKTDNP